jgi:hypothetical protein
MSASQMGQIGTALRTLLNNNGFGSVRIVGYEHNWVRLRQILFAKTQVLMVRLLG